MFKQTIYPLSIVASLLLLSGCATDNAQRFSNVDKDTHKLLKDTEVIKQYQSQNKPEVKKIHINARNQWIYPIIKKVAKQYSVPLDKHFIPSKEYRIDADVKVGFNELLNLIYRQTGVRYSIEDGVLKVRNNEVVEPYERAMSCTKGNSFSMAMKGVSLKHLLNDLSRKGYNIEYDAKYYNLDGTHYTLQSFPKIDFYYKGCSYKEAMQHLAKKYDLDIKFRGKNVTVRDYQTLEVNLPQPFNMSYSSGSSNVGGSEATSGLQLSDKEDTEKSIKSLISSSMSKKGKAYLSKRGYITVTDTPESIKRIKRQLKKEINSQQNIKLKITVVSIDLSDKYSSGVDWSGVLSNLSTGTNAQIGISAPLTDSTNALSISDSGGIMNLLQFLGEYGKSKIVTQYTLNTRSGIVSALKSVDIIPYVTTSTVVVDGVAQVQKEAKSTESGIVLNIKPTLDKGYVNLNVDATLSQYLGDKDVGDGYILPMQKDNKVQTHITTKLGDTAMLSGLKLKSNTLNYKGIPKAQNAGLLNTLTGANDDTVSTKEYLIFITPMMTRG